MNMTYHYKVIHNNKPLDVYINPDDTLSLVYKKIAVALETDPNNIYTWIKQPVIGKYQLDVFLHNTFKGENIIDTKVFANACYNAFGLQLDSTHTKMITRSVALKQILDAKHVFQPLGHYYMDGEYIQYLPYNPLKIGHNDGVESSYLQSFMQLTIETVINNSQTHKIYVITKENLNDKRLESLYFPFVGKENNLETQKKYVSYIKESETVFTAPVDDSKVNTTTFLNILYVKSKPVFKTAFDLSTIFNNVHASENIPFIKYKARTNIYHKAYKPFLANAGDVRDFEKWYEASTFKMQENTYIVFKIKYGVKGYISYILNDKMQSDIRFNFYVKDEEKIGNLPSIMRTINDTISQLELSITLPQNTRDLKMEFDIQRLATFNIASLQIKANKANAEAFVKTKMFHYFDVLPSDANNILRLQYKKVDNFGKTENILMFIQHNSRSPKEEIIQKIMSFFSLSEDEAENEYDKWEAGEQLTAEMIKYERFVEVKLRFNSPIDVKYVITGATSLEQNDRIVNLVSHILESSANKTRETKKDIEAKKVFIEEEAKKVSVESPLFDDDDDWAAELKELENEFKEDEAEPKKKGTEDVVQLPAMEGEFKLKGFVKKMLDAADRDLFNYKSEGVKRHDYASMCGWVDRRQPIVITGDEKKIIDEKYPGAYEGFVKSGSTAELEKRNFYICPKIWCPRSRVAIPPALYKQKGNEACPLAEEPIVFESKSFWGLGDKAFDRKHIPGFLAKHTRPDGLCLPCCFKVAPNEGNRNKQRQELCVPRTDENEEVVVDDAGAEKYIKGEAYFPLESGRYGLIPQQLQTYFGKSICGSRHNGTGLINEKTDCYLRKGIFHGSQSFVNCMIQCLENTDIQSYKDFLELINKRLTITQFMLLENGKIVQLFIDRTKSIFSDDYKDFRKWLLKDKEYVTRFNLLKLQKELETREKFTRDIMFYKDVIREFMIYYSYKNFIAFMNQADIEKDHRILLDLFNINTEWLNVNGYNFVVMDIDTDGRVYVDCSLNRDTRQFVNKKTPVVYILKYGRFYEPLCHVKSLNDNIISTFKFDIRDEKLKNLFSFYFNNCSGLGLNLKQEKDGMEISLFLESKGLKPKYYVIDYSFRLCGLILLNNLYVPFTNKKDIFALRGLRFVYISDVVLFKCLEEKKKIAEVYKMLKAEYGVFYNVEYFVKDNNVIHGIVLNGGQFVPVNLKSGTLPFKGYLDDLYLFINEYEDDERTRFIKGIIAKNDIIKKLTAGFEEGLNEDQKIEVMFLKDSRNPLPLDYKRKKMVEIMETVLGNTKQNDVEMLEVAELVLNKFYDARRSLVKKFLVNKDEVLFDYNDVQGGRLVEFIERSKNPYKLFHKKLNTLLERYILEEEKEEADVFGVFFDNATFSDVPAKYGTVQYRKILKGYNVLDNDNDIIYKLFSVASKISKQTTTLSEDVLKSIVKTNIVKDYNIKNLETLESNPAYVQHMKKMKLKTPTIDQIIEVIDSIYYRPSFYEIRVLARAIDVNVILIGRQTLKNPDGLFEVIYTNSPYYLFMIQSFDRHNIVDNFQLIVKNKKDILLTKRDIPTDIIDMINSYMAS